MTLELILNLEESLLVERLCERDGIEITIDKRDDKTYLIYEEEVKLFKIAELIKDSYVTEGFDIQYNLTKTGVLFEGIIDKLYKLGF